MANMAQEYAETIRDEVESWEKIHHAWGQSGQDPETVLEYLADDPDALRELEDAGGVSELENFGGVSSLYTELHALDAWLTVKKRYNGRETVESVTILRTCGGPNCEIVAHESGGIEILAYWGGDTGRVRTASEMIEEAAELATEAISYGVNA